MEIYNTEGRVIYDTKELHRGSSLINRHLDVTLDLTGAIFDEICLEGCHFDFTILTRASFKNCNLYWAGFDDVDLAYANFEGAVLKGSSFVAANLYGANLTDADFSRDINEWGSKFHNANLDHAIIKNTNFQGAEYNSYTIFPAGFLPQEHGMVFSEEYLDWGSAGSRWVQKP